MSRYRPVNPCRIVLSTAYIALAGVLAVPAYAQTGNPLTTFEEPPALESQQESLPDTGADPAPAAGGPSLRPAPGGLQGTFARIPGGSRQVYRLRVRYVDGQIWNPSTGREDNVRLRSYHNSRQGGGDTRFVAPLMRANQGASLWVRLANELPADDPSCPPQVADQNEPHCFNTTNLHTHGVWANPNENQKLDPNDPNEPVTQGDNVFHKVAPGQNTLYRIDIPADHPGGTFWYHAHVHGSTALQVSSGMAGALIIRGRRQPTASATGDLDVLLRSTASAPLTERTMLFQQIQYHCTDGANGSIKRNADETWRCDEGDVGGVERYDEVFGTQPGRGAFWRSSGRYTMINGAVMPDIGTSGAASVAGRVERWRLLHGGVRDTIRLAVRKVVVPEGQTLPNVRNMSEADRRRFVSTYCTGEAVPMHLVAADGLTMAQAQRADSAVLQPGYRWDALMVFPSAGQYCVLDEELAAASSVNGEPPMQRLLGISHVGAGTDVPVAEIGNHLRDQLVSLANTNISEGAIRESVVADLRDSLKLSRFVPHRTIADGDLTTQERQTVNFNLVPPTEPGGHLLHHVNNKLFNADDPARILKLGDVQEWEITSGLGAHPFHIHVNPFQIVRIEDASGKDVSAPGADDAGDPQYPGMKGQWRDTVMVKSGYKVIARSRYERFVGDFVLHCHILDHEDLGMMERVRIHDPARPETLSRPYPKHFHGSGGHAEAGVATHAHH